MTEETIAAAQTSATSQHPCEQQLGEGGEMLDGNVGLIYPGVRNELDWGSSQDAVVRNAAASVGPVDTRYNITAKANGNSDSLKFTFLGPEHGLSEVSERHNNARRAPPFVTPYIDQLREAFGDDAEFSGSNGACQARWATDSGNVVATWRDSEWFIEIEYTSPAPNPVRFTRSEELEIWRYHIRAEDRYGGEEAERRTIEHFDITRDELVALSVRGIEQGWPMPALPQ